MKKYFFFDIDGTLTDKESKKVIPSALKTLRLLQEQGHFVAIATGRAHYKAIGFMKEVGLTNMVCNGGNGIVIDGILKENAPLDFNKSISIIHEAQALGYGVLVAPYDSDAVYGKNLFFLEQAGFRKEPTKYYINPKISFESFENIYKFFISIPQDKEMELTLKDTLGYLRFEKEYLMFQPDYKQSGIKRMMQLLNADSHDVVVFGDDYNDIDMFQGDWYSIAMGNACDALKQIASEVTESNVNDGIYQACLRHEWIRD